MKRSIDTSPPEHQSGCVTLMRPDKETKREREKNIRGATKESKKREELRKEHETRM